MLFKNSQRDTLALIWSIWPLPRVHSNHSLGPSVPKFTDLIGSVHKTLAVKKWLPYKLICAVDLDYIVTIHFVRPYPSLLSLY